MSHLTFTVAGGIGTITIDRPPANALNDELSAELDAILARVETGADVRCLIIHSANPRFFMAGGDINKYAGLSPAALTALVRGYRTVFRRLHELPVPTIAVADGHAQGGGAEMLLACDFRVVGSNVKIGLPEVLLGGVPSAGGTQLLAPMIGYHHALELMLSGRSVEWEEAVRLGLATSHDEDPLAAAERIAAGIAAMPPTAVRWIKRCTLASLTDDHARKERLDDEATAAIGATAEFHARVQAFIDRHEQRQRVES
jgi:enoyl-CoA hydratase